MSIEGHVLGRPELEVTSYLHPSEGICLAATVGLPLLVEGNILYVGRAKLERPAHPHLDDVRPILARYQWSYDDDQNEDDHSVPESYC